MDKKVRTNDLKIGMYIKLKGSWIDHPFLKNEFMIKSQSQINKLKTYEVLSVMVDIDKSDFTFEPEVEVHKIQIPEREPLIPPEFLEVIHDLALPPQKKAKVVYNSTIDIMHNLMDNPVKENIKEFTVCVADIVELILNDRNLSSYLLGMASHDLYTYTHSVNVGILSILLSKSLFKNSNSHDMHKLGAGFFLHDIGMMAIDQSIINKNGPLTESELVEMKKHPNKGYIILDDARQLNHETKMILLQHHERFDGTGYPKGLLGEDIHMYGRICSVADVYDALSSQRPYKEKLSPYYALKIMKQEMLNHFHKEIFDEFVMLFR